MPVSHLEHFLIIAEDVEATTAWYVDVLGFRLGEHPDFGVPVNWLYLGDGDVIHITQAPGDEIGETPPGPGNREDIARGGRPIHHVAFRASGLKQTLAHLEAKNVAYIEQQAGAQNLYQVFMRDPNGITVELNFPADEAEGLSSPKLALTLGEKD
jgi:catechol 2,3-dioxygenase-like lactoylglutathione lyase family enzyme